MNVLITGAAKGLGRATANYFASNEHNVYVCDLIEVEETKNINSFVVDVTDVSSINSFKQQLIKQGVFFDIIINFAGVYEIGSFVEFDLNKIKRLLDVNLMGAININQILYDRLIPKGRIVIISSEVAALDPMPFNGIYNVSKAALDCYSQSLRQELNLKGQKVITIRPGAYDTDLTNSSLILTEKLVKETKLYLKQSKNFLRLVKAFMGKPKSPEKLAKLVYKVSMKRNPKYIYSTNKNFGLVLLNLLPKRLQCFIIKMLLK